MKNYILIIAILSFSLIGLSFSGSGNIAAQSARLPSTETMRIREGSLDMLTAGTPSDQFYSAKIAPLGVGDNDDDLNPGGSEGGNGDFVGGIPISDGVLPLVLPILFYLLFIVLKKYKKETSNKK